MGGRAGREPGAAAGAYHGVVTLHHRGTPMVPEISLLVTLVTTVAAVWIPLAAELTPANAADNEAAPRLLDRLPPGARFVLGDAQYNDPALREQCAAADRCLVTPLRGRYPHTDDGVEVRRLFHELRSRAI